MTMSQRDSQRDEEWRERLAVWLRENSTEEAQEAQETKARPTEPTSLGLSMRALEALESLESLETRAASPDAICGAMGAATPAPLSALTLRSLLGKDPPLARYGH